MSPKGLVLVVVVAVFCVAVPVMDVIRMVAVLDSLVGAIRCAVGMVARRMLRGVVVLVVVVAVLCVTVAIMKVIDVVAVLDSFMGAVG